MQLSTDSRASVSCFGFAVGTGQCLLKTGYPSQRPTHVYPSWAIVDVRIVPEPYAAGVTPKLWEMSDMVKVLEDWENTT
jgi:hypothetical protein